MEVKQLKLQEHKVKQNVKLEKPDVVDEKPPKVMTKSNPVEITTQQKTLEVSTMHFTENSVSLTSDLSKNSIVKDTSESSMNSKESFSEKDAEMDSQKDTGSEIMDDFELPRASAKFEDSANVVKNASAVGKLDNFLIKEDHNNEFIDIIEAQALVEELINIQEMLDPDFRISYDPQNLQQKYETIYVSFKFSYPLKCILNKSP